MKIELHRVLPTLIITTAVIFHVFTIRPGHDWGGDFSLYIAHARNIIQGIPYAETGYIFNPHFSYLSPATYPPVFPLLLAPIYKIFGLDLYSFRVYILLLFMVFLFIYFQYAKNHLSSTLSLLGALAAIAFSPWIWDLKNSVWSEIPFLFFLYAALILLDRIGQIDHWERKHFILSIAAGLTLYLAYGTRSVGLLLVPALIAKDLINFRTIRRASIVAVITFTILFLLQSIFMHSDKTYGNTLALLNTQVILDNIYRYFFLIVYYWDGKIGGLLQIAVIAFTMTFAVLGFGWKVRRQCSPAEIFLLLYIGVLIFWPGYQGHRYLLPIVPLTILYFFLGIEKVSWPFLSSYKPALTLGMILLIAIFNVGSYSLRDFSEISYGVEKKESREMFDFIRTNTPQESIIIFWKPRVLALFTGRKSSCYHEVKNPEDLWAYFNKIGVTHLVVKYHGENFIEKDFFLATVQYYKDALKLIFQNADFKVYEIKK